MAEEAKSPSSELPDENTQQHEMKNKRSKLIPVTKEYMMKHPEKVYWDKEAHSQSSRRTRKATEKEYQDVGHQYVPPPMSSADNHPYG